MNNVECESCVKRKTMYCPNSFKCYATKNKPYWQNRIMLLEENKELHNKIDKATEYLINPPKKIWEGHSIDEVIRILKDSDTNEQQDN